MELLNYHYHKRGHISMQGHNITDGAITQEQILRDTDAAGKPRPWAQHRTEADYMQAALAESNPDRAAKMQGCGTWLEFAMQPDGIRLHDANFCRVRLCPLCQWRRSLKIWSQTSDLVAAANSAQRSGWIMLTLTQRNVDGWELRWELDRLYKAWNDLARRKEFRRAVLGWMRVLEVTHNSDLNSGSFDTFHPHFHALLQVRASYFHSRDYIPQHEWAALWADCMQLDYIPSVDVHAVRGDSAGAIAEVSKYAVKPADVLTPADWDLTVRTVEQLDKDLNGRRLIAYGGTLRQLHHQMHLDDAENGDLVHTSQDDATAEAVQEYISYSWAIGYREYIKSGTREGAPQSAEKKARAAARCAKTHKKSTQ